MRYCFYVLHVVCNRLPLLCSIIVICDLKEQKPFSHATPRLCIVIDKSWIEYYGDDDDDCRSIPVNCYFHVKKERVNLRPAIAAI